mgnify:CR=1 FL=1
MPAINEPSAEQWKQTIAASNEAAMNKRHKYPPCEGEFLQECCVFVEQDCPPTCFCRKVGCSGVWTLRADLDFGLFVRHYANLWIRGLDRFCDYVMIGTGYPEPRWRAGAELLRNLKPAWHDWDGHGRSLAQIAASVRRCYFCNDAFELIAPVASKVRQWALGTSGVHASKLLSQLFYDIAVPADTQARRRQASARYDPDLFGGGRMQQEARNWLVRNGMSVDAFRQLDDAPRRYWRPGRRPEPSMGAPCSRVLDKLFYGHDNQ